MSNEPEKIGVDVWIAATIYVDAASEEEAAQIVAARYAGTRDDPDTYDHMNGKDLPLDGDDFMSSAFTLYGLCANSRLVPVKDKLTDLREEADWMAKQADKYNGTSKYDVWARNVCRRIEANLRASIAELEGRA